MKTYRPKQKCYCGSPESCNVCRPNKKDKQQWKRKIRSKLKRMLKKESQ